ncbi:MAG: DNA-binding IclR family transcriptional regulator [Granulosicoccus sp.]|jgi:DNA-binding IclR family transcriptional regulator
MAILRAMNGMNISRITKLQRTTGLPSATVVRIIETFESLGYVQNHGRRTGYTLTKKPSNCLRDIMAHRCLLKAPKKFHKS